MNASLPSLVQRFQAVSVARRRLILVTGAVLTALLLLIVSKREARSHVILTPPSAYSAIPAFPSAPDPLVDFDRREMTTNMPKAMPGTVMVPQPYGPRGGEPSAIPGEPRISYAAQLAVVTKEFAHTRSSMEEILERHRGYTARLRMAAQPSGSVLSATLRVPASEYSAALGELKTVGDVERDEEAADEIVQQRGDLEARLQNAQNTERRLQKYLGDHSGMAASLALVEQQQLIQLRSEIGRMQAEREAYDNRAVFSNIYFSLREEKIAPAETFAAQLRGASLSGFSDALHVISAILLVCVNYGPSLLLWVAILFFPVRLLWRRSRPALQQTPA